MFVQGIEAGPLVVGGLACATTVGGAIVVSRLSRRAGAKLRATIPWLACVIALNSICCISLRLRFAYVHDLPLAPAIKQGLMTALLTSALLVTGTLWVLSYLDRGKRISDPPANRE